MMSHLPVRRLLQGFTLLLCLLCLCVPSFAESATGPLQVIQSGTDRALQILRSSQAGQTPNLRQRRDEILKIVDEYFNFNEMAKRALGQPWKAQSPEKQREFVQLFKQLLFNTYVDRVEAYTGNNEQISYEQPEIEGEYALIKTRVRAGSKPTDVQVDYRMRQENGEWKVYDVIVEGISFVNNYRQQFNSILASDSFDGLLNRLRQKVQEQRQS